MIYVLDTTTPAEVRLPRTLAHTPEQPILELVGTADRQRYAVPISDFAAGVLYYTLRADFSGLKSPGEYEYLLLDSGLNLAAGILRLGPRSAAEVIQYENAPIYEQYNG